MCFFLSCNFTKEYCPPSVIFVVFSFSIFFRIVNVYVSISFSQWVIVLHYVCVFLSLFYSEFICVRITIFMMIRYSRLLALLLHYCTHDSMLLVTFFC